MTSSEQESINKINNLICINCGTKFKYPSGLSRHKTSRCQVINELKDKHKKEIEGIIIENNKEMKNIENKCKIEKLEERVVMLQDQLKKSEEKHQFYEKIIRESNVMAKTTVSAFAYAMLNLTSAPRIRPIANIEQFILDGRKKDNFEQFVLYLFRNDMLQTHIAGMIVKAYKTPNPEDQTFWNTDAARLSYILRDAVGDVTEWQTDKGGVKIRNMVIEPMLENMKLRMIEYLEKCNNMIVDKNNKDKVSILKEMEEIHELIDVINSKTLAKDIIRCIAPQFHLDVRNVFLKESPPSNNKLEMVIDSDDEDDKTNNKIKLLEEPKKKRGRPKKVEKK
jgi:hypothetical protein